MVSVAQYSNKVFEIIQKYNVAFEIIDRDKGLYRINEEIYKVAAPRNLISFKIKVNPNWFLKDQFNFDRPNIYGVEVENYIFYINQNLLVANYKYIRECALRLEAQRERWFYEDQHWGVDIKKEGTNYKFKWTGRGNTRRFPIKQLDPNLIKLRSKNPNEKKNQVSNRYGGGESKEHKQLKQFIYEHPEAIGIKTEHIDKYMEFTFPSNDSVDILFKIDEKWLGIEIKAEYSDGDDLIRGLYQCIKYKALIEAVQMSKQIAPNAETILVFKNEFPKELLWLKNILGIHVKDQIEY